MIPGEGIFAKENVVYFQNVYAVIKSVQAISAGARITDKVKAYFNHPSLQTPIDSISRG